MGTSLDYSVGSPLATPLTAGLNCQGMHHAMPAVSMAHFPAMYAEYEAICHKHGVRPRQSREVTDELTNGGGIENPQLWSNHQNVRPRAIHSESPFQRNAISSGLVCRPPALREATGNG